MGEDTRCRPQGKIIAACSITSCSVTPTSLDSSSGCDDPVSGGVVVRSPQEPRRSQPPTRVQRREVLRIAGGSQVIPVGANNLGDLAASNAQGHGLGPGNCLA